MVLAKSPYGHVCVMAMRGSTQAIAHLNRIGHVLQAQMINLNIHLARVIENNHQPKKKIFFSINLLLLLQTIFNFFPDDNKKSMRFDSFISDFFLTISFYKLNAIL